jgi:uncharacterized protein
MNAETGAPAVVVTGASSGIGREIARLAAKDGQPLILIGRSEIELVKLAEELRTQGVVAHTLSLDLQHPDALAQIEACLSAHGLYCDVLVNSAGFGVFGGALESDSSLQTQLIDVNIRAVVALTLRFLPGMVARRRGGIINLGSITGYASGPYMAAYCASKAFVNSWSAALSAEVAGTGVTVTCLTPGVIRTAFFNRQAIGPNRLLKILPRGNVTDAAQAGWTAFKAGKTIIVPRFIDRFIIRLCWLLPDRFLLWMVRTLQRMR